MVLNILRYLGSLDTTRTTVTRINFSPKVISNFSLPLHRAMVESSWSVACNSFRKTKKELFVQASVFGGNHALEDNHVLEV